MNEKGFTVYGFLDEESYQGAISVADLRFLICQSLFVASFLSSGF